MGDMITFSSTSAQGYLSLIWDMGDGTTANGPYIKHSYQKGGNYLVTLNDTVNPCSITYSKKIHIRAPEVIPILGDTVPTAGRDTFVYKLDHTSPYIHKWSITSGALISRPDADSATVVWYDTLEYSGHVKCDFINAHCLDNSVLTVYPKRNSAIQQSISNADFKVYPNPTSSKLTLEYSGQGDRYFISITDVTGQQLYHTEVNSTGRQLKELSIANLPAGIYYLRVSSSQYEAVKKIIKL
jgi:hypothetical protein